MMVKLQKLYRFQTLRLLEAINREDVDNQFWAVSIYENSWNAAEIFSGTNQTEFEPGYYITVMYDEENQFPTFSENLRIVTDFPHYDYWIEAGLRVLIFKI